jgi:ribosome-binding factor A
MYIEKVSRSDRIAKQIQKQMTNVLYSVKFADRYRLVSISRVDVSRDLRNVKIFYTTFAGIVESVSNADIRRAFKQDNSQLRQALVKQLNMKYAPEIRFIEDKVLEQNRRVEAIIDNLDLPEGEQPA